MLPNNSKFKHLIIAVIVSIMGHSLALGDIEIPLSFEVAVQDALLTGELDRDGRYTFQPKLTFQLPRFTSINPFQSTMPEMPADNNPQNIQQAMAMNRPVFAENRGQWPEEIKYQVRLGGVNAWITDRGVVYDFYKVEGDDGWLDLPSRQEQERERLENSRRRGHVVEMSFESGLAKTVTGWDRQPGYYNYFLGDDPSRWASFVPLYGEVIAGELYTGVNVRYYIDEGYFRYDLETAPGSDLTQVQLSFNGADDVWVTPEGELAIATSLGVVRQMGLLAYQEVDGRKEQVPGRFVLAGDNSVGFEVEPRYPDLALIIDPLLYSTFLGGSGDVRGYAIALDSSNNAYVTGYTVDSATDFPTTSGAYDESHNGGDDVFVAKLNSMGSSLSYSTFIGGSNYDWGYAIALDSSNNAYVTGYASSGFPTTTGAYDESHNGSYDVFVAKLNSTGSSLVYSTFLGGSEDDEGYAIALDSSNNAYVTGFTDNSDFTDFPTTSGAYDEDHNDSEDVFVAKLNSTGSSLVYSTFLGGVVMTTGMPLPWTVPITLT